LLAIFFIIHLISADDVGLAGRTIGSGERSDSATISRCRGGGEIECGMNTVDSSFAIVSAFSLSVTAKVLFGR
jgi:hypothetical protein